MSKPTHESNNHTHRMLYRRRRGNRCLKEELHLQQFLNSSTLSCSAKPLRVIAIPMTLHFDRCHMRPCFTTHCLDTLFRSRPQYASVYAIVSQNGEASIFDTGTPAHYRELKDQLSALGVNKSNLTKIFVSHVHMDHCGNAFLMAKDFPNAVFYAHPNSVPHLSEPGLLMKQTKDIMKSSFDAEYGNNLPGVPAERIVATSDGMEVDYLKVIHTEGHSNHHISLFEPVSKTIFTGDSFGTMYPQISKRKVFVSTSPATFNPDKMIQSITKMMNLGISRIGLAHFGFVEDVEFHYNACVKWLKEMKDIARSGASIKSRVDECFRKLYGDDYERHSEHLKLDILVNGLGVAVYAKHLRNT